MAEILRENPDAELQASNRLYEAKLRTAAQYSAERDAFAAETDDGSTSEDDVEELDRLTAKVKKAQAEALLYANEAYYSEGAVRHVVGNMQAKHGIDLTAQHAMQSFNEQLGDTLKDISHYDSDFGQCAYRSSKYVDRLIQAAREVTTKLSGVPMPSTAGALGPMASKLLPIRKGSDEPYKSMNDAQKATEGASIASAHGVRCVSDLKSSVVKTGSELNATAREKIQATPSDSSAA